MKKINLNVPLNNTGYGVASWNIFKELLKEHYDVTLFPIGNGYADNEEDMLLAQEASQKVLDCDLDAPLLKIWHQFDLLSRTNRGRYFALPFFELDKFNALEQKHLTAPDCVFVTSEWAKQVVLRETKQTNVEVVPLGVDNSIFYPVDVIENDTYKFFNIGKWEIRKGHDFLLKLFQTAFPDETDVELHVLASETTNGYSDPSELYRWKSMYLSDNRVKLLPGLKSHTDIANYIATKDCGIFPSRAEGWNLELLESMAMSKPVITTNYSAHTEFCDNKNSYLVDITETEPAVDGKAFKGQGSWAKIGSDQFDQLVSHMRDCYSNRVRANPAGLETANRFGWNNTVGCITRYVQKYS